MPCDLNETDPFEQIYKALWTLVERNPYIQSLFLLNENNVDFVLDEDGKKIVVGAEGAIKPKNRIKFDKNSIYKVNIAHADTPELQLLLGPISDFTANCTERGATKAYTWALSTGTEIRTLHNKIAFELWRSMVDYEDTLFPLTWCGCPFVKDVSVVSEDIGRQLRDLNREVIGWASLVIVEVKFGIRRDLLKVI